MTSTILHTKDGKLDIKDRTDFDALCTRIKQGAPRVLVHLHGGLVDQASGDSMAKRLAGHTLDSYNAPLDWEQIYIIWRTGAFETLRTNWRDLAKNDRLYNALLKKLIEFMSGKVHDLAATGRGGPTRLTKSDVEKRLSSGSDAPFADFDRSTASPVAGSRAAEVDDDAEMDLGKELEEDTELEDAAFDIEASLATMRPNATRDVTRGEPAAGTATLARLDDGVRKGFVVEADQAATRSVFAGEISRKVVKHGVAIGTRVIKRYRTGRDHGLHATVVEEIVREFYGDLIGSIVWGMMQGDAADHFSQDGFGTELADALSKNKAVQLMIVAHSAGSIFASELLIWAARNNVDLTIDLVFLAPAVRTLKFAEALKLSEARIVRFRSFFMKDEWERKDPVLGTRLGFIYPSSLLYLVSGLFEEHAAEGLTDAPLVGMARFLNSDNGWLQDPAEGEALSRVQKFLNARPGTTVLSKVAGGDGLNCDAISHGDFDNDASTLASVIYMISQPRL